MSVGLRLLICGGLGFADRTWVAAALSETRARRGPISILLHGDSTRVDPWAHLWAARTGIPCAVQCARSVFAVDLVLVFPGRGTASMVRLAKAKGLPVG